MDNNTHQKDEKQKSLDDYLLDEGAIEEDEDDYLFNEDNTQDESDDDEDDQRYVDQFEPETKSFEEVKEDGAVKSVIKRLKNIIIPQHTQERDLSIETGGLEEKKPEDIKLTEDAISEDIWDKRPKEIDDMGLPGIFEGTGMRSEVWKKKKNRLDEKKDMIRDSMESAAIEQQAKKDGFRSKVNQSRNQGNNTGKVR